MTIRASTGGKRTARRERPLTIHDGERYFDARFSEEEREELRERIVQECGFAERRSGFWQMDKLLRDAETEIMHALNLYPVPGDWTHIHVCRQLEIDYKSFAKNVPKLPIEPFYKFVESRFPHFKPAKNKMQRDVQKQHIHLAFIDWIDSMCPENGCKRSHHGFSCWDRFEKADYLVAAMRIWEFNAKRPKFKVSPLRLVHSV